jgi:ribosomal-protein-alanine N-acetyltransferase
VTAIVAMTVAHIKQVMIYERDLFGPESWSASAYREELADRQHRLYLAAVDDDGSLLGWAGVRVLADVGEILTVGVVPTARRQGIGSQLLVGLLAEARRRGAEEVFLDVRADNEDAQRIYAREGFIAVGRGRGYYDHGRTDSLIMSLKMVIAP